MLQFEFDNDLNLSFFNNKFWRYNMTESKKQNAKICFLATAAFSLVANAFAYFNLTPHHKCHAIPQPAIAEWWMEE